MRILSVIVLITLLGGCTKTENGLVFGVPDYEKRDISVSQVDLEILNRANQLLSNEGVWAKDHPTACTHAVKLDLYCALEKASISVQGKYIHRQAALQEVRFAIDDHYKQRWNKHRLIDFNSNKDTHFYDVKRVIELAISAVEKKLQADKN